MSTTGRLQDDLEEARQEIERLEAKLAAVRGRTERALAAARLANLIHARPGSSPPDEAVEHFLTSALAIIDAPRPWGPYDPTRPW